MNDEIRTIAESYLSLDDLYDKLIETNNVEVCQYHLDYDDIWKRLELNWMLEHFQEKEEYEKCIILKEFMNRDYIASELKQVELNDKLEKVRKWKQ